MTRALWWRGSHALLAVGALGALVASGLWRCPTAEVFHLPCPGCGLTRATLAALHGDFHASFHFHPVAMLATPLFVAMLGLAALHYVLQRPPFGRFTRAIDRSITVLAGVTMVLMIAVWAARFFGAFGGPVPV
jgi:hypothetical protein